MADTLTEFFNNSINVGTSNQALLTNSASQTALVKNIYLQGLSSAASVDIKVDNNIVYKNLQVPKTGTLKLEDENIFVPASTNLQVDVSSASSSDYLGGFANAMEDINSVNTYQLQFSDVIILSQLLRFADSTGNIYVVYRYYDNSKTNNSTHHTFAYSVTSKTGTLLKGHTELFDAPKSYFSSYTDDNLSYHARPLCQNNNPGANPQARSVGSTVKHGDGYIGVVINASIQNVYGSNPDGVGKSSRCFFFQESDYTVAHSFQLTDHFAATLAPFGNGKWALIYTRKASTSSSDFSGQVVSYKVIDTNNSFSQSTQYNIFDRDSHTSDLTTFVVTLGTRTLSGNKIFLALSNTNQGATSYTSAIYHYHTYFEMIDDAGNATVSIGGSRTAFNSFYLPAVGSHNTNFGSQNYRFADLVMDYDPVENLAYFFNWTSGYYEPNRSYYLILDTTDMTAVAEIQNDGDPGIKEYEFDRGEAGIGTPTSQQEPTQQEIFDIGGGEFLTAAAQFYSSSTLKGSSLATQKFFPKKADNTTELALYSAPNVSNFMDYIQVGIGSTYNFIFHHLDNMWDTTTGQPTTNLIGFFGTTGSNTFHTYSATGAGGTDQITVKADGVLIDV